MKLGDVTVQRAMLHNPKEIARKGVLIGKDPLHRESIHQNKELAGLQETLSASMGKYETLIKRLEEAIANGDITYDTLAKHKAKSDRLKKPGKKGPDSARS